jgi:cellulase/cellobiase CelA1
MINFEDHPGAYSQAPVKNASINSDDDSSGNNDNPNNISNTDGTMKIQNSTLTDSSSPSISLEPSSGSKSSSEPNSSDNNKKPKSKKKTTAKASPKKKLIIPSPTTYVAKNYSLNYEVNNIWESGATITMTILNKSSSNINGWSISWNFSNNEKITELWNAKYTQTGKSVKVTNFSYNSIIQANGTVVIGFNLTHNGSAPKIKNINLN